LTRSLADLPIVLPDKAQCDAIITIVDDIIAHQKVDTRYDYRPKLAELDHVIADLYALTTGERTELSTWFQRHYPKLTGDSTEEE